MSNYPNLRDFLNKLLMDTQDPDSPTVGVIYPIEKAWLEQYVKSDELLIAAKAEAWDKLTEAVEANEANMEFAKYDDPEQERLEALDKLITEQLFEFVTFKKDGYTQSQQYRKFYGPKPTTT